MKKFLLYASIILVVTACDMTGHSQYSMTSITDFEYDMSNFDADSLFLTGAFYGDDYSYSIVFNSMREGNNEKMTGGVGATMKRDSSIVLKENNAYPQYTMYATSAARNTNACAVFYQNDDSELMPEHDIIFTNSAYGTCTPSSFMINNTQQTVYDVLSEESPSKFEPGDWLKLTVSGSKQNEYTGELESTGTVEYYLADWRKGYAEPDSLLTSWKTVRLTKLGEIDYIDFSLETNKENLTKTFCFDYLVTSIYLEY